MSDDDNDRAAILARRQRFIALALSGLACTSTEPAGDARPNVCLKKMMEPRPREPEPGPDAMPGPCLAVPIGEGREPPKVEPPKIETDTANPNACLSIAPPEPPPPPPKPAKPVPCLELAAPPGEDE
jgi:hypothetical protein